MKQRTFLSSYMVLHMVLYAALLMALFLVYSCDLLRNGLFEVSGWNPGYGYHNPAEVEITLDFTLEADRNSVERSFSLHENNRSLPGNFSWFGNRMIFSPAAPLVANRDYTIILRTDAQDIRGLNLERQFEATFTTRTSGDRPVLLATVPDTNGIIADYRGRVELLFSRPMNRSSLVNLSFSPSISGVWSLEQDGILAVFTPSENWINGRSYRLLIGAAAAGENEVETGMEYILHFSAGIDLSPPQLLEAFALDSTGNVAMILSAEDGSLSENALWERNYRLGLVFSKPVNITSVNSSLSSQPSLGMAPVLTMATSVLEPTGFASTIVYRFTDEPSFGSSFILTLGTQVRDITGNTLEEKTIWRIRADGPGSKPPFLRGMRFPKIPPDYLLADEDLATDIFLSYRPEYHFADFPIEGQYYTFHRGISTWMELYFETAKGALIDPFSLMERFRFSATNGAVSFSPRSIVFSNFTVPDPVPGWENYQRAEIRGVLLNHPYTGMVTIEIGSGLRDNLQNKNNEAQRFLLLK